MGINSLISYYNHNTSNEYDTRSYIENLNIINCSIGISILSSNTLMNRFIHSFLWLSDKNPESEDNPLGLVIEYGNFSQEDKDDLIISHNNENPKNKKIDKNNLIYHYGNKGGLRYYIKSYDEFSDLANEAFVELSLDAPMSFKFFINECASLEMEQWIKEKYHLLNNNCHSFIENAIRILKPKYSPKFIYIKDKRKKGRTRESSIPTIILNALKSNKI